MDMAFKMIFQSKPDRFKLIIGYNTVGSLYMHIICSGALFIKQIVC